MTEGILRGLLLSKFSKNRVGAKMLNEKKVEWPLCRNFRIANTKITKYELSEIINFNSSLSRITITRKVNYLIILQT